MENDYSSFLCSKEFTRPSARSGLCPQSLGGHLGPGDVLPGGAFCELLEQHTDSDGSDRTLGQGQRWAGGGCREGPRSPHQSQQQWKVSEGVIKMTVEEIL